MKKSIILLCLVVFFGSCKESTSKNNTSSVLKEKPTSSQLINFNLYSFNTVNTSKEKIKLEKNKKYVLDFWYLECVPCVKQHKQIQEYQEVLKQNKIEIIGISIDKDKVNWEEYLEKHGYNWKNYNQFGDKENLKNDLNLKLFPTYLIINSKGEVLKKYNSFQQTLAYFKIS